MNPDGAKLKPFMLKKPRLVIFVFMCALVFSCSQSSPEQAIRQQLVALEEAIQAKNNSKVRRFFSPQFSGRRNEVEKVVYQDLQKMLAGIFIRHASIGVTLSSVEVKIDDYDTHAAEMQFSVLFTGAEGLIPNSAKLYQVEAFWKNNGGDWRIYSLNWQ